VRNKGLVKAGALIGLFALAFTCPLWMSNSYVLHVLIVVATFAIGSMGVRLVWLAGQLNVGQAAFYAVGAYVSLILASSVVGSGVPVWIAMPLGGLAAAGLAAVIGYPALRVRGMYFSILTLGLFLAIQQFILLDPLGVTGGTGQFPFGVASPEPIGIFGITINFADRVPNYYLALAFLVVAIAVMYRIERSRLGLLLRAISQSSSLAQSTGLNIIRPQWLVFVVSSFFAGLAGAFYSHYLLYADANLWGLWESVYFVIFVIFGGITYFWGPLLGAFTLLVLVELIRATPLWSSISLDKALAIQPVVYALLLISVIIALPRGLLSLAERVGHRAALNAAEMERPLPLPDSQ
jgi:branched-chain amino acid transport system permease protein